MSYQVLARKWRPKNFADTVGQEHVLQALVNALDSGRLHHAYLFSGTRGVGKTTIARGHTMLESGDHVLLMAKADAISEPYELLGLTEADEIP